MSGSDHVDQALSFRFCPPPFDHRQATGDRRLADVPELVDPSDVAPPTYFVRGGTLLRPSSTDIGGAAHCVTLLRWTLLLCTEIFLMHR